jgi:hypothetical protein
MESPMQDFFSWFGTAGQSTATPWLILGKGQSYGEIDRHDISGFRLMSLNHVVRDRPVTVAHAIDLDVAIDCAEAIDANAGHLVMPWVPHQKFKPGKQTLKDLLAEVPILAKLDREGRLLFYNASTAPTAMHHPGVPVVPVTFFSAEAALGLLVGAGVQTVRSLGVDGGTTYATAFADLSETTRLANTQPSFDKQFARFADLLHGSQTDFAPLNLQHPVRVFVGSEQGQALATKVLAWSIRRHASISVEVTPIDAFGISIPVPADSANAGKTPFSFQRFVIPQICGHAGRAIYVDSDMLVFKDIRQMWQSDMGNAQLLSVRPRPDTRRPAQHSVLLLDCGRLGWDIADIVARLDRGALDYQQLISTVAVDNDPPVRAIGDEWNALEHYQRGRTALLHYTDMPTQPWVSHRNPLGYLWFEALFAAIDDGHVSVADVADSVRDGHIRPSTLYQVEHRIADGRRLPRKALALDTAFIAPYQHLTGRLEPGAHLRAGVLGRLRSRLLPRAA